MKKSRLMYCLLALSAFAAGCDPTKTKPGFSLSAKEICDPSQPENKRCLALDEQHAAILTLEDGKLRLDALDAEAISFSGEKGFKSFREALLQDGNGYRFQPIGTRLVMEKDQLVFSGEGRESQFKVAAQDIKNGFLILLNDGEGVMATLYNTIANAPSNCNELTDKLSEECMRITHVGDHICLTHIGVVEILDNAIDPDLFVRIQFDDKFWDKAFPDYRDFRRSARFGPGFRMDGFRALASSQSQSSTNRMPLHFAQHPTAPPAGGSVCSVPVLELGKELCRYQIGDRRLIYCDQGIYRVSESDTTLVVSVSQEDDDFCFKKEGDCLVIMGYDGRKYDTDFCTALDACKKD
jgi:hypothetical protein